MSRKESAQAENPRVQLKAIIKGLMGQGDFFAQKAKWTENGSNGFLLGYRQTINSGKGHGLREGQTVHFTQKTYSSAEECKEDLKKMKAEIKREKSRKEKKNG